MQTNPNINAERIKGHLELDPSVSSSPVFIVPPGQSVTTAIPGGIWHYSVDGNLYFSNSASTFILNQNTVAQSNQTLGFYALGNTTQSSSGTFDARSLSVQGYGIASVGFTNGSLVVSVPAGGGGGDGYNIIGFNGGATTLSTTLQFSNSNGISVGFNAGTVTFSHNGITQQSTQPVAVSAANGSFNFSTLKFVDTNGVSFISSTDGIRASVNTNYQAPGAYLTTAALSGDTSKYFQNWKLTGNTAGTTSSAQGTDLWFSGGNGVTLSGNNNTIVFSVKTDYLTTAAQSNQVVNSINGNTGVFSFAVGSSLSSSVNGNSFTWGLASNITTALQSANANYLTSQSNQALSGSNGSFTFQTATFGNLNGISFYTSNGSLVASHNAITSQTNQNISLFALGNTTQNSSTVLNASNLSFNALGIITAGYSNGSIQLSATQSNQAASGSNGSFTFQTLSFGNLNGMSFYTSNGSIVASYTDAGAGGGISAINISAGTTSNNLTNFVFSNSNGVSFGLNGSTVTASVAAAGGTTREFYNPYGDLVMVAGQVGQGTMNINPNDFPNITMDRVYMPINITNSSNSSGSHTLSFWLGIYTRNVSTLSLVTSQSTSYALTHSGTAGSYSLYSGMRHISMGLSTSLPEGLYYVAIVSRTTSGGANGSYSQMLVSNLNTNFLGHFSSSHNTTYQFRPGLGVYSVTTSGIPNSIGISQIRGSDSLAQRPPIIIFANSTI